MALNLNIDMTIAGVGRSSDRFVEVINPANGQPFTKVPAATEVALNDAVESSRAAFRDWRSLTIEARREYLIRLAAEIRSHSDELGQLLLLEQGRPAARATSEIVSAASWLEAVAAMDVPTDVVEDTDERRIEVRHEPLGVVAAIVPWNFPFQLAIWKIAPALITGNTVVLKPSPYTPLTALRLGEISRGILPPGVLNVISGDDSLGPMMTSHPGFAKISFTGSTATGKRVMETAAKDLKRITLELGGNDAAIVMPDVNLDEVAERIFFNAFFNSAQICVATKRLYIHEAI